MMEKAGASVRLYFTLGLLGIFLLTLETDPGSGFLLGDSASLSRCPVAVLRTQFLKGYREKCFEFVTEFETYWDNADRDCRSRGGHLVTVGDEATQTFIMETLRSIGFNKHGMWIGLNDREHEQHWVWATGESLGSYRNWGAHEGNGITQLTEDCVHLRYIDGGKWHDVPCHLGTFHYTYICQYQMIRTTTTKTTSVRTSPSTTATPSTPTSVPISPSTTATPSTSTSVPTSPSTTAPPSTATITSSTTTSPTTISTTTATLVNTTTTATITTTSTASPTTITTSTTSSTTIATETTQSATTTTTTAYLADGATQTTTEVVEPTTTSTSQSATITTTLPTTLPVTLPTTLTTTIPTTTVLTEITPTPQATSTVSTPMMSKSTYTSDPTSSTTTSTNEETKTPEPLKTTPPCEPLICGLDCGIFGFVYAIDGCPICECAT